MASKKQLEELTTLVQSRVGEAFIVIIEDGMAVIEHKIEDRYARAMVYFQKLDGRKKLGTELVDSIVHLSTEQFNTQSKNANYTEQAKSDASTAYKAIVTATQV